MRQRDGICLYVNMSSGSCRMRQRDRCWASLLRKRTKGDICWCAKWQLLKVKRFACMRREIRESKAQSQWKENDRGCPLACICRCAKWNVSIRHEGNQDENEQSKDVYEYAWTKRLIARVMNEGAQHFNLIILWIRNQSPQSKQSFYEQEINHLNLSNHPTNKKSITWI